MKTKTHFTKCISFNLFIAIIILLSACNSLDQTHVNSSSTLPKEVVIDSNNTVHSDSPPPFVGPLIEIDPISQFVRRILQDSKGNLWMGTNGDGVLKYDSKKLQAYSSSDGFGGIAVRGIAEDSAGNIWFGTEGGLTKYNGKNFINYTEKDGLPNNNVWALFIDSKNIIWIGTLEGACSFDGSDFTPFALPKSEPDPTRGVSSAEIVHCITEDHYNNLWFCNNGGAYKYDRLTKNITHISVKDGLAHNSVNHILEDDAGNIWFATHHNGVSKFDGKTYTNFTADGTITGDEVWSLFKDDEGNIWFPAEHHGVYKYNGEVFTNYSEKDGLNTNAIQCIHQGIDGKIWLGGYKGLFRFDGEYIYDVNEYGPW